MLKTGVSSGNGGGRGWARPCDSCHGAACAVYCQADFAYLCASCDSRIHAVNQVVSQHERVWVCEACEQAPAAFIFKADAANPLAQRHHRVPIVPVHGCIFGASAVTHLGRPLGLESNHEDLFEEVEKQEEEEDADETESCLLLNPIKSSYQSSGYLFDGEVHEYLDFVEYNNSSSDSQYSVVPVNGQIVKQQQQQQQLDSEASNLGFSYSKASVSHNISLSSTANDISNCHTVSPDRPVEHHFYSNLHPTQMQPQFSPKDREARVLRYREKRKTRKFEKTIRYASRKAYAESRPRIKGRFAKITDAEHEVDKMFAATVMGETGYGIVPSF